MGTIPISEMMLRLSLAFVAGFAVGWERESRGRPAGLRTNILACLAAAVAMIVSENLVSHSAASGSGSVRADPARLGAGILAGIGFLGGGTILRHENFIRGVTTAATLWTVTILGLAFGAGLFALGGMGVAFALITLFLLARLEKRVRSDWYATLTVTTKMDALSEQELRNRVEAVGASVKALKLHYDFARQQTTLGCDVQIKRPDQFETCEKIIGILRQIPGVLELKWGL